MFAHRGLCRLWREPAGGLMRPRQPRYPSSPGGTRGRHRPYRVARRIRALAVPKAADFLCSTEPDGRAAALRVHVCDAGVTGGDKQQQVTGYIGQCWAIEWLCEAYLVCDSGSVSSFKTTVLSKSIISCTIGVTNG